MVFLVKMPLCWSLVTVTSMAGLTCMMENGYMVMLGRITAMETTVLGSATTTVHSVVFKSANIYWNSIVLNTYICIHKHCILNSVFLSKSTTKKHQDVMFKAFTACWILKPQLWTLCSITNASSFPHFCVSVCAVSFCHRVSHPSFFPCMFMSPNLFSICVYVSRRSFYLRLYFSSSCLSSCIFPPAFMSTFNFKVFINVYISGFYKVLRLYLPSPFIYTSMSIRNNLEVTQMWFLRRMMGVSWSLSN